LYGSVCLSKLKNTMTQKSLFDLKNHKCWQFSNVNWHPLCF
jgi:hypothetical protein